MSETTEANKIQMARLDVEARFHIEFPKADLDQYLADYHGGASVEDISSYDLQDFANERDLIRDGFEEHLQSGGDIDIDTWGYDTFEQVIPAKKSEEAEHKFYTEPAPDLMGRFNMNTGQASTETPFNRLTDEQLRGAMSALNMAFGGRTMHKAQRDELQTLYRETEMVALARPSLHAFEPFAEDAAVCHHCGKAEAGHRNPEEQA